MPENQQNETLKTKQQLDRLIHNMSGLIETRLKLFKLDAEQEFSRVLALSITLMMMCAVACVIGLFASIALAIALGEWLDNYAYGFLAVSGIYVLLLIGINYLKYSFRDNIGKEVERQWKKLREYPDSKALPKSNQN